MSRGFNGHAGALLDVHQAAELLGTTEKLVRARIARGLLPHRRLGGRVILLRAEILTLISTLPGVTLDEARANLAARRRDR